ncbi:MAG: Brp/Blh family beta-carotene 15,15'-dioxygenase [Flavobacteriales bacterium]|jgi:Brp/Blh family beta-carotene 15,15'-monooxygenase
MSKEIFIFIASVLLIMPMLSVFGDISLPGQLVLSAPFIILLGIPHGAIDNVLYIRGASLKQTHFIAIYLLIIAINILLWVVFPVAAYVLFLVISAYHFGQSQFSHYFKTQKLVHQLTNLLWGVSILSALTLFNLTEIKTVMSDYSEFSVFDPVHHTRGLSVIFGISTLLTLSSLIWLTASKALKLEALFMEVLILALIFVSFYLMPVIIGFTLYFVILHSFKVLGEEYRFLKLAKEVKSRVAFVKLLTPFSILSFFGMGVVFALIHFNILAMSYGYCLLIIISSITLPHVFVMNKFYKLLFKSNFYQ